MSRIRSQLSRWLVTWKTRGIFRKLVHIPVQFPVSASQVKNALVLLPFEENYLDPAMTMVRNLRQHFKKWHFMILDVNKIPPDKLDSYLLPGHALIEELQRNPFQLVINLNFEEDLRIKYLIGMLQPGYRLHVQDSDSDYYNMLAPINREEFTSFNHVLNYLKSSFLV